MAQRPAPQSGSAPVTGGGSSRKQRGKPVPVQIKQSRPWGLIVGSLVLVLALVGILGYAVSRQGSGFEDPLEKLDGSIEGVALTDAKKLSRDHVDGDVTYDQNPPTGGDHNATQQVCQIYDAPVPAENAVHSLEHGAVWISYQPDLAKEQVATLRELAEGEAYVLMSPNPGQQEPIVLSAWGRRLPVTSATDDRVERFVEGYANGPQTPEKGATCSTGSTATGTQVNGGAGMPQPAS